MNSNLYSSMSERWAADPGQVAIESPHSRTLTYAELDDLAARMDAVLLSRGVRPGDRVVAQVEKSIGAVALYLGSLRAGAVFVPLNTAYTDTEVAHFLADAEPRVFVRSQGGQVAGCAAEVLGTDEASPLWAEALSTAPSPEIVPRVADDLAAIVYTSGTTGRSKGAMLSHGNLASNARTLVELWAFGERDVLLHALPIYHVHGLFVALHCAFLSAARVLFLAKFDAAEVRALLPRATVLMGVPTFYTRLLALEGFGREDCPTMRLFISGSAPLLAETWREFERRTGHAILERYGMTETGMITSNPLDGERIAGTVGFALPDVEIRLADEDGTPVEAGAAGVLEVKGPNVFAGYWRMPERSAAERRADGFFVTGDVATMDAEGRVTLVGRAKDLIITGGLNVYPKEIEEVLDACDGVEESAVVGVPDADFGEAVVAVVVPARGAKADAEPLMDAVRACLARFKHPRRVVFVEELPRNAMGKVQKNVLRDRLKNGSSRACLGASGS
jgi:malonyl-CoA/methylmalonyl-CoA synthetase